MFLKMAAMKNQITVFLLFLIAVVVYDKIAQLESKKYTMSLIDVKSYYNYSSTVSFLLTSDCL